MANRKKEPGFWSTLPGILTGVAAVLTAVTGLVVGIYQYSAPGSKPDSAGRPAAGDPLTPAGAAEVSRPAEAAHPAEASPSAGASSEGGRATVTITSRDGAATPVFADSLRQIREWDKSLHLLNGQTVVFDRIKTIEVTNVYEDQAKVRITLVDGRAIEGSVASGSSTFGFHGENDLGVLDVPMDQLKRIEFRK